MRIDEYLRNRAFKLRDTVRKNPIKNYVQELQDFEISNFQYNTVNKKLHEFLVHAHDSSPFYKHKAGDFDLNSYPIINKKSLSENATSIYSTKFEREKLIRVSTSGSYGTPFKFYLSPEKKKRQSSEVIYYGTRMGYEVGVNHAYFRTTLYKSKIKLWLQNETFISSKILGNDFLVSTRLLLKKKKVKILTGFPSALTMLAEFCSSQGDRPKDFAVNGVITFAESLTPLQRDSISKVFGCKVYSRYGTEELGILGCQSDNDSGFALNTCNYIIEILDLHKDQSVEVGKIGRVVITDLHSDAFPLIRYETGDLAVLDQVFDENKGWAKRLKTLSGRTIQMLTSTSGEKLYPLYFENIIEKRNLFIQFQLIQETDKEFVLKLVPGANFNNNEFDEKSLIKDMSDWLGQDAHIKVELVEDIEMLPSGKRPSIINRLENAQINVNTNPQSLQHL